MALVYKSQDIMPRNIRSIPVLYVFLSLFAANYFFLCVLYIDFYLYRYYLFSIYFIVFK